MNKLFSKKLVFFVTLLLITLSISKTTYAAESTSCDNPPAWKKGYCTFVSNTLSFPGINIERTMMDATTSMLTNIPTHITHGRTSDQMQSCIATIMGYSGPEGPPPTTDDDCSDLKSASVITGTNGYPTQFRSSSSILGIAMALEDIALNDTVPVNLAYYAKYQAAKIPGIRNMAFAASPADENILLQVTLEIWEVIRDISFGLLAIFMLVIGIMIMLRHKVNPQTVVSVQSAIPRIIISIIFIAFSYPIGALAISLINPLSSLGLSLLAPAFENISSIMGATVPPFVTALYALSSVALFAFSGAGLILILMVVATFLVGLFFLIKVFLTIIMTYVHLIYAILSAPLIFAWGVIPGNEDVIPDWFKRLGVKVITIPIVIFGFRLTYYMTLKLAVASAVSSGQTVGGLIGGAGILVIGIPILIIGMLIQLGKLPQKLDELVLGKKK